MSITSRSVNLKELLTATARNNPKKFVIILALGGLSAATAYWLIKKFDNKKNSIFERPEKAFFLDQIQESILEKEKTTSLKITVHLHFIILVLIIYFFFIEFRIPFLRLFFLT